MLQSRFRIMEGGPQLRADDVLEAEDEPHGLRRRHVLHGPHPDDLVQGTTERLGLTAVQKGVEQRGGSDPQAVPDRVGEPVPLAGERLRRLR